MDAARNERLEIREVVENWVVWRDAGDWERFAGVWHDDGVMMATWSKMTISQRAVVEGIPCDIVCTGRFFDFFEKRKDRWAIVLRQPIYEKDRMDSIAPGAVLAGGSAG